jgi:citrate lyase subunit beta-like protein
LNDEIDLEKATKIFKGYQDYSDKGIGTFDLDGKMIDTPMVNKCC